MTEPLHGYQIKKMLSQMFGINGAISYGSLYPNLAKLHSQGLIETTFNNNEIIPKAKSEKENIFSTGSLTGDIASNSKKSIFAASKKRNIKRNKKVYSITPKGRKAFKEKLATSFIKNADNDRTFVMHLAFMENADDDDKEIFIKNRINALENRLALIPESDNKAVAGFNNIELEYINHQINFLNDLKQKTV